ncbi:cellulose biosynthesis protein BcsS [Thiohalorhabdus sp.]|uniref:cellulose biosynthesis protein BcsS n=1 Tax=Thiohalorhabdus sp. TaxID=3094134 RepID=UPI002FC36678
MRPRWILAWLLAASTPVGAASPVWLAGTEIGPDTTYAYAGVVAPVGSGSPLGDGWFQRYWLDWLRYTYEGAADEVEARAPGAEAAWGYQWPLAGGKLGVSAGAVYRHTTLDPSRAESAVQGARWGAKLQAAGRTTPGPWRLRGIVSYVVGIDAYWGRLRAFRGHGPSLWPGAEVVALGDPEYQAVQLGAILGQVPLGPGRRLTLKAGARLDGADGATPYAGVELAWGAGGSS